MNVSPEGKAKEPLLAVAAGLFMTGLGQVYAGSAWRGLAWLLITVVGAGLAVSYMWDPSRPVNPSIVLAIPAAFFFELFVLIDAYRCARRWNAAHGRMRRISWPTRIALVALIGVALAAPKPSSLIVRSLRAHAVQAFRVSAATMEPALKEGDCVLVDKAAYHHAAPARGDIIAFRYPKEPARIFLMRLAGLPGETVEIRDGRLVIDGALLEHPSPLGRGPYSNEGDDGHAGRPVTVPPEAYFVLGDRSPHSLDSRYWGFVPKANVIGKVRKIYFPFDRSGPVQ